MDLSGSYEPAEPAAGGSTHPPERHYVPCFILCACTEEAHVNKVSVCTLSHFRTSSKSKFISPLLQTCTVLGSCLVLLGDEGLVNESHQRLATFMHWIRSQNFPNDYELTLLILELNKGKAILDYIHSDDDYDLI